MDGCFLELVDGEVERVCKCLTHEEAILCFPYSIPFLNVHNSFVCFDVLFSLYKGIIVLLILFQAFSLRPKHVEKYIIPTPENAWPFKKEWLQDAVCPLCWLRLIDLLEMISHVVCQTLHHHAASFLTTLQGHTHTKEKHIPQDQLRNWDSDLWREAHETFRGLRSYADVDKLHQDYLISKETRARDLNTLNKQKQRRC